MGLGEESECLMGAGVEGSKVGLVNTGQHWIGRVSMQMKAAILIILWVNERDLLEREKTQNSSVDPSLRNHNGFDNRDHNHPDSCHVCHREHRLGGGDLNIVLVAAAVAGGAVMPRLASS